MKGRKDERKKKGGKRRGKKGRERERELKERICLLTYIDGMFFVAVLVTPKEGVLLLTAFSIFHSMGCF